MEKEIPTRENAWMTALAITFVLAVLNLIPAGRYTYWVAIGMAVVEAGVLVWMIWRLWSRSSLVLDPKAMVVMRRGREIRRIEAKEMERVVLSGGAVTVYRKGKVLPALMRAFRARSEEDKQRFARAVSDWCRKHQVPVQ
ncbi:MAG: hypothetical protein K6T81_17980 [Alicyclobacillus macrosporangiidus]|uniref:hypothetical protein n=1 Tax=Alicyclobacillus macrosporangiidus TaxID=392015 RepID=UPI0026E974FF|nr:hypothetical protein [Alicyclobacillus macrosporangiidus]MCL6600598.1 hypothetical protein [Alicyclobacillus macrosporangiidus]